MMITIMKYLLIIGMLIVSIGYSDGFYTYIRSDWGFWVDTDKDCQNTRSEILQRDAESVVATCTIKTGVWIDVYSGKTFLLAKNLDIDHVIPLKYAHEHGASLWSAALKQEFTNDFDNLLAVSSSENRSKGALGPSKWMPYSMAYWCTYVDKWISISNKYSLKLAAEDELQIKVIQRSCK